MSKTKLNFTRDDIAKLSDADRQRAEFIGSLKGKAYPKDIMGRAIQPGDVIVFGTGTQAASGLYFGLVEKFNYKTDTWGDNKGKERISSVTCKIAIAQNGKVILNNKRGVTQYMESCILDDPPKGILQAFLEYADELSPGDS